MDRRSKCRVTFLLDVDPYLELALELELDELDEMKE